ncbi:melanocortin receptor 5-like [Oculina patagonica]
MAAIFDSFCSSNSSHYYPAAQQFPKTIYIFACVFNLIISVSSILGNILILFALRKCQSLHSPSKALLCSLALTDLFVGLVVRPLFISYYLMIILEMPTYYCVIAITYARTSTFIAAVSLETIATIAVDRYLAFHLRLRYRELVKFRRVVFVLVSEWMFAAVWSGIWFWNALVNMIFGAIGLFSCCLITPLCYISIYRGLRRHVAQIHQQVNSSWSTDLNVVQYKKTVNNMLWIYGLLLVCYIPHFTSLLAVLAMGLNNSTRFALHFGVITVYVNSSLNPILYCWKINEIKEKVIADLNALRNFLLASLGLAN